ncbi:MAG: tetratricopeptide repeat protein [Salinivirgaceae bacterium]|nr:tetratricopeptide repeat protein [Salinivirgaceae bacterium]MBR5166450.1 tetratricopeptide repeat protein [Salinivirgaceae bacterium]
MKRLGLLLMMAAIGTTAAAQSGKVVSATNFVKQKEFAKAKENIEMAIQHEKTKEQAKTWMVRGDVYMGIAESKDPNVKALSDKPVQVAMESYRKAMALDTKGALQKQLKNQLTFVSLSGVVINNAIDYSDKKDYASSLECFEISLEIDSIVEPTKKDSVVIYNAGWVAEQAKMYSKAKYYYNKSIDIRYNIGQVFVSLANIERTLGDTAAFVATLERGIETAPEDSKGIMVELINHYIYKNQADKALSYLDQAIEKDPKNKTYHFAKGSLLDKINKPEEAKQAYEKAIEIDPNYFDPWYNRGIQVFNQAVEISKKANDIPMNKQKEYDAAIQSAYDKMNESVPFFEKAHSINPQDKSTMQVLKECYYKLQSSHPEYVDKYKAINEELSKAQ